jgi:hypothetical protein
MSTKQNKSFPVEVWKQAKAVWDVLQTCEFKTATDIYTMLGLEKQNDKHLLRGALERLPGIGKGGHGHTLFFYHGQAPMFVKDKPVAPTAETLSNKAVVSATGECINLLREVPPGEAVHARALNKICGSEAMWQLVSRTLLEKNWAVCPLVNGRRGNLWYAVTEGGK